MGCLSGASTLDFPHAWCGPYSQRGCFLRPQNNELQMIVRAHECVMDGFERFAQGHLITLFSATNYCGTANNAGAILVTPMKTASDKTSCAWGHQVVPACTAPSALNATGCALQPQLFSVLAISRCSPALHPSSCMRKASACECALSRLSSLALPQSVTQGRTRAVLAKDPPLPRQVLGRDLVMVPKLIHPLPPNEARTPLSPGEEEEDIEEEPPTPHPLNDTWMQVGFVALSLASFLSRVRVLSLAEPCPLLVMHVGCLAYLSKVMR